MARNGAKLFSLGDSGHSTLPRELVVPRRLSGRVRDADSNFRSVSMKAILWLEASIVLPWASTLVSES